jgi:hypothetical protein
MNSGRISFRLVSLSLSVNGSKVEEPCNDQEKRNDGEQDQEPRDIRVSRLTDQLQGPCPEGHIEYFDEENHENTIDIARQGADTINIGITHILNGHDEQC